MSPNQTPITMQPVTSTNVASVGYDPAARQLLVAFQGGRVYRYFDVPENVYQAMLQSSSVGRYFASAIKGAYTFTRES